MRLSFLYNLLGLLFKLKPLQIRLGIRLKRGHLQRFVWIKYTHRHLSFLCGRIFTELFRVHQLLDHIILHRAVDRCCSIWHRYLIILLIAFIALIVVSLRVLDSSGAEVQLTVIIIHSFMLAMTHRVILKISYFDSNIIDIIQTCSNNRTIVYIQRLLSLIITVPLVVDLFTLQLPRCSPNFAGFQRRGVARVEAHTVLNLFDVISRRYRGISLQSATVPTILHIFIFIVWLCNVSPSLTMIILGVSDWTLILFVLFDRVVIIS